MSKTTIKVKPASDNNVKIDIVKKNNDLFIQIKINDPLKDPTVNSNYGLSDLEILLKPSFCRKLKSSLDAIGY